jgi:poly(beta-D-mannuronate) lyase
MSKHFIFIVCFCFAVLSAFAKTYKVENISQFNTTVKLVNAGDSIILKNGVWKDVEFKFKAKGEPNKMIYLVAETPGKVTIEGKSRLQLSGQYLYVSGLTFINGSTPKSVVIEFRTSSTEYAYNSVLNQCVIDKFNQPKDTADHWVGMYGKKNVVEYCYFGGKSNEGTTLVVWPNDSNSIDNGHLIYRNYFGPRPRLGSNGGETIRIGTSHVCMNSSRTIVDGNYFEHCNGETEIISNKSCDNIFVNNTFFESEGSLVMRHGDRGIVAGNWFIGNGKINTGGVRVINEGHKIYNNYFYKLRGDDFRSALAIMNAIPDSPLNGYMPVKNVIIANNTYYDCSTPWSFGVGFGDRNRIVKPESTLLLNNLIYSPNEAELIKY